MTGKAANIIELIESVPAAAQELSAARLARDVMGLLSRAFDARGIQAQELATRLNITPGAVSQVMNGDGNLRMATLGRYLRALGYEARVELVPVDTDAQAISTSSPRRRRKSLDETTRVGAAEPARSTWTVLDNGSGNVFNVPVTCRSSPIHGQVAFHGTYPLETKLRVHATKVVYETPQKVST